MTRWSPRRPSSQTGESLSAQSPLTQPQTRIQIGSDSNSPINILFTISYSPFESYSPLPLSCLSHGGFLLLLLFYFFFFHFVQIVIPKAVDQVKRINASLKNHFLFRQMDEDQYQDIVNAMFEKKVPNGSELIVQVPPQPSSASTLSS